MIILAFMTLGYIIAQLKKDTTVIDIFWGAGFILLALFSLLYTGTFAPRQLLVTLLVLLWGMRLSVQLFLRNRGKGEDPRYKKMRDDWGQNFALYSFVYIFMLQAVLLFIISLSVLYINGTPQQSPLNALDLIGTLVWLVGFCFETIGDLQLYTFLKNPLNKGTTCQNGLWRYTRHPNYFGEATMWWGIFLIALSVYGGWITIISPLLITFLLLFVSGIPMNEKLLSKNPDFAEYKRRTSMFFPWLPKD
jgi:steroid 5-alpha reductase family enzyme